MPFLDFFRRYPQPYHHRIDTPAGASHVTNHRAIPTANEMYNNATPEWIWDRERGGWTLVYTYEGYQFTAMPDHRITNSWYANYGANPKYHEDPDWNWVWDPRVRDWVNRPTGSQVYGTAFGHVPDEEYLTATQKRGLWARSGRNWYGGSKAGGSATSSHGSGRATTAWGSLFGRTRESACLECLSWSRLVNLVQLDEHDSAMLFPCPSHPKPPSLLLRLAISTCPPDRQYIASIYTLPCQRC